ncbi:MAG: 50S ribosomal protein L23 [Pseudomonadota bacterium]
MLSKNSYDLILRPVITEKSSDLQESSNKYQFVVANHATKNTVTQAIAKIFSVEVDSVNILIRKGKVKRFRGKMGKRSDLKVATVTLKKGQKIDYGIEV